jgi:hypothetical protein
MKIQDTLGSYSYKNTQARRFSFTDTNNNHTYYFQITPVNSNVAAVQFYQDNTFLAHVAIPANFTLVTANDVGVLAFNQAFFITWIDSYELRYNNVAIWKLTNQKQQSVRNCNGAIIASLQ